MTLKRHPVRVMMDIYANFDLIAELAAKRLPGIVASMDVPLSEADKYHYRMAIFSAVLDDKPNIDETLDEIERLAREKVQRSEA